MQKIKELYFFGNSYKIAQALDRICSVKEIFCEKRCFNQDIYNFAKLYSIKFNLLEIVGDLDLILQKKKDASLGVSFGFGIIFKKAHIKSFKHGIWNIHTGGLPENRGRHPISWSFLNNCKKFIVTIHQINEEIDKGYSLAEGFVYRDLNDTQIEIDKKIEELLESVLILKAFDNYSSGKKRKLEKGVYNKNLIGVYNSVLPEAYDSRFLFNLFKSQAKFCGVTVEGKQYIDCVFYNESLPEMYKGYDIFACKDGKKIGLK